MENTSPTLLFFRTTPNDLMSRPPLCSSLQNLESCFFLIALDRYPHALVSCASSIESCLKAAFNIGPEERRRTLEGLLNDAKKHAQKLQNFDPDKLNDFRKARNSFVHFGFSPTDDNESARLLLETGFNFLNLCYGEFFSFSFEEGLLPDYHLQLRNSIETYDKVKGTQNIDFTYCFMAFNHLLRWSLKGNLMSHWELAALERAESDGETFGDQDDHRKALEGAFDPCYFLDCPICSQSEALGCELDGDQLDAGTVSIARAICVGCGLKISKNIPYLANIVCEKELEKSRAKILEDFGIEDS